MKKTSLWILAAVPLVMVLGNSMLIPVLPAIKKAFGVSTFQTGLIITFFSVPAGLFIPFTGFMADRLGRRAVLIPALSLYALSGLAAGLSWLLLKEKAFPYLLASRAFQGIGAAGTAPIAMAMVGDLFGGKQRSSALGFLEAANGVGKIISPILGAAVGILGWFYPFFVFPIFVAPVLLATVFLLPNSTNRSKPLPLEQYATILSSVAAQKGGTIAGIFLAGMTSLMLLFGLLFFLSDHIETALKINGILKGVLLAIPVAFMCITACLTGRTVKKRLKIMPLVSATGLFVLGGALASFVFLRSTLLFFAGISLAGVGAGLTLPCLNTLITSSVGPNARGAVTALYGGARFMGVAIGPPLFAFLLSFSSGLTFGLTAVLAGTAAIMTLVLVHSGTITSPLQVNQSGKKPKKQ